MRSEDARKFQPQANTAPLTVYFFPKIKILFSDAPLLWERDRLALVQYVDWVKRAAQRALEREEVVLISIYPVYHGE